jgi:hypothetical protein
MKKCAVRGLALVLALRSRWDGKEPTLPGAAAQETGRKPATWGQYGRVDMVTRSDWGRHAFPLVRHRGFFGESPDRSRARGFCAVKRTLEGGDDLQTLVGEGKGRPSLLGTPQYLVV